jgi:CBS domain-containing protein
MTSAAIKHPILRLEVLASDGTRDTECRVFCQLQRRSVLVDECCSCVHCDAITDSAVPSVDCTIPVLPRLPADDPTGDCTEVGTLLRAGTVVVAESATLRDALGVLHSEDRRAVAIVDDHHVLVGLVHETSFMGRRTGAPGGALRGAMSTALAVHERTPVRAALRMLAASHLREATVVSDEGTPIGIFRDVDGLRWIYEARELAR